MRRLITSYMHTYREGLCPVSTVRTQSGFSDIHKGVKCMEMQVANGLSG